MLDSVGSIVVTFLFVGLATYFWISLRGKQRTTTSNRKRESVRVIEQLNSSIIHSKSREIQKEIAALTSPSKMNLSHPQQQPLSTEQVMRTLLDQARVFLAQGHPSKALSCVLAAVRHQRGEVGVFEVLNETREAHGLRQLAVPLEVTNSLAAQLPTGSSSFSSQSYHRSLQSSTAMSDDHMDDSDGPASRHTSSFAPSPSSPTFPDVGMDPADVVESLFRKLGVVGDSPRQNPSSSSTSSRPSGSNAAASSSSASSSSSFSQFDRNQAADDFNFEVDVASTIAASAPAIHYPSLRTQLPSLTANPSSGTSIQLMHEEPVFRNTQVTQNMAQPFQPTGISASAFPAASSSAAGGLNSADANDPSNSLPLLSVAGKEHILDSAYDDEENVSCTQCGALIPRRRFAHHLQYWCQTDE